MARLCFHFQRVLYIIEYYQFLLGLVADFVGFVSVAMMPLFLMVGCFQMSMSVARSLVFVVLTLCVGTLKEDISVCAGRATSEETTPVLVRTFPCLL